MSGPAPRSRRGRRIVPTLSPSGQGPPGLRHGGERAGIDLGDWFVSPLYPITKGLERWGYRAGTAPIAEAVCSEIVNLPTDPTMSERDVDRVLGFLGARIEWIR